MDLRDTAGYRMHRALNNHNDIKVEQLKATDRDGNHTLGSSESSQPIREQ